MERSLVCVSDKFLDLREDVPMKVEIELGLLRADHLREVLEAQLVTVFKLAVVLCFLLNCIVG